VSSQPDVSWMAKPAVEKKPARDPVQLVDEIAERHGYVSREAPPPRARRQRRPDDPMQNFTMRLPIADTERFIRYCERERLTYREAFAQLLQHLTE
jgi:hypothetical protein